MRNACDESIFLAMLPFNQAISQRIAKYIIQFDKTR